jgi:hypothetical protein
MARAAVSMPEAAAPGFRAPTSEAGFGPVLAEREAENG